MRRRHIARHQCLKSITTSAGMEVRNLTLITGETVACVAEGRPPPSGFALSEPHVGAIKAWANVAGAGYPCLVCDGPAAEVAGIALICGANPNVIDIYPICLHCAAGKTTAEMQAAAARAMGGTVLPEGTA